MAIVLAINAVIVLLAVGIASGIVPAKMFSGAIAVLHTTIGITLPSPGNERPVALLWIAALLVIGDGILFLLVFLAGAVRS